MIARLLHSQKLKYSYLKLIILVCLINFSNPVITFASAENQNTDSVHPISNILENSTQKIEKERLSEKELQGIEVEFDYQGHERERDFFYNYYLEEVSDRHPLKKEEIGLYLFDLNNDGKKEVLIYIHNLGLCGVKGCLFEIFRPNTDSKSFTKQAFLQISTNWGFLPEIVKILDSITLGYHDIEIAGTIWRWDGKKYN